MSTPFLCITLAGFLITTVIGPLPACAADEGPPFFIRPNGDLNLPPPGVMVHLSPPLDPPVLKGIRIHRDNPFRFDFILDKGGSALSSDQLKDESSRLVKYFLTSLTIPEKDLWVNLSPYEKDRIIPQSFGLTAMGRDLLAEDYMLKQITASLIYPAGRTGREFWKKVYAMAVKKYGTADVPVNTFNKVWIVPEKAVVYENAQAGTAYVVEAKLKVMLEQDYLSLQKHEGIRSPQAGSTNQLGDEVVRQIVLPELDKEVNEDRNFAVLRQIYNSLILATWYKKEIKDSILEQVYANKDKVAGVTVRDPLEKAKIYERYLQAFKRGVYNYIKVEKDPFTQKTGPRKYFSGGMDLAMDVTNFRSPELQISSDPAMLSHISRPLQAMFKIAVTIFPSKKNSNQGTSQPAEKHVMISDASTLFFVAREEALTALRSMFKEIVHDTVPGFRTMEVLGKGGTAVVYKAPEGGGIFYKVAQKEVFNGTMSSSARLISLLNEAGVRGVPKLLEVGLDGHNAFWMKLKGIEGGVSLDKSPEVWSAMPMRRKIGMMLQITRTLQAIHRLGWVHNDIKPANIIINQKEAMLIDFGTAREIGTPRPARTMAYSDIREKISSPSSDMYSLGRTLQEVFDQDDGFKGPMEELVHRMTGPIALRPSMVQVEKQLQAMAGYNRMENGGIDLTAANMNLQTRNSGGKIKVHFDSAQLARWQNAPGFVPVIVNVQPLADLRQFLGIHQNAAAEAGFLKKITAV
ncbi:MAG: protein kinase [Candidatus Omnitrophica bacterium]|nr:protein kinase [Candidatus Omnitrophota bacterium]